MKISIIGGGAIGLLLSSYLSDDHEITLYVKRDSQVKAIDKNQVQLIKDSKELKNAKVAVNRLDELTNADCYFICVKQPHLKNVIPFLNKLRLQRPVIFLQNGMSHLEYLQTLPHSVYVGIVEHGAKRINDYQVCHLGEGTIKLANITGTNEELQSIINALNKKDFPFLNAPDFQQTMKDKLIINCVINPLTALFNVPNESVITNEYIRQLAKSLCSEAAFVLRLDKREAWEKVHKTAMNTGDNTSSMLADIRNGKQTEIHAISGFILKKATIELPFTTFVYHAILALERKER